MWDNIFLDTDFISDLELKGFSPRYFEVNFCDAKGLHFFFFTAYVLNLPAKRKQLYKFKLKSNCT